VNTVHLAAAQVAWNKAIAEVPCPLGIGENDAWAWTEAANAAEAAGATSEEAVAMAYHLNECGGSSRLLTSAT
jgi:hypothetical protein